MPDSRTKSVERAELDFHEFADAQDVISRHSKSFALASKLLPREVRSDVRKLYGWCRWCDNAVDEAPSASVAKSRLAILRLDIDRVYLGQETQLPASRWLAELVQRYELPKHLPLDLLLGMESDLDFKPIQNVQELELYCYRVAGVVGLMMCRLLGVRDETAYENANRLGIAMQMTNIARDIAEDWERGRCYLPQTWVELESQPDDRPTNQQVAFAVQRLLQLAEQNYQIGYQGYPALPGGSRIAIRVAAAVYRAIGTEIKNADFKVMNQRHFVPASKKVGLVLGQLVLELRDRVSACFSKTAVNRSRVKLKAARLMKLDATTSETNPN